jgi:mono/diheme cytochrome c family protein
VFRQHAQDEGLSRVQTEGKRLFAHYCATCHGAAGQGDGQNAYNLDPAPPDFGASLKQHPHSYWRQIIESGSAAVGRSPLCPPWGRSRTGEEIDALLAYLETLSQPSPGVAAPVPPGGDGR